MASFNLAIISFFSVVSFMSSSCDGSGFPMRMLHGRPPPSSSPGAYWNAVRRRSLLRHNAMQLALTTPSSTCSVLQGGGEFAWGGEYVIELSIGTPPQAVRAVVESAGSFIWVDCSPGWNRSRNAPSWSAVYSASASSTFSPVLCNSTECSNLDQHECGGEGECRYTRSVVAHETIAFAAADGNRRWSFDDITFHCCDDGDLFGGYESARLGLVGGAFSLVSQLGHDVHWRLSYCLSPQFSEGPSNVSRLYVGEEAILFGGSTPLTAVQAGPNWSFFSPTLADISVGDERVGIPTGTFARQSNGTGGVFLDTGTQLTYLARVAFDMVLEKVTEKAKLPPLVEPAGGRRSACYNGTFEDLVELKMPYVTLHFDGLDVPLHPLNQFAPVGDATTLCWMARPTDGVSIIGAYAQTNLMVGYDFENQQLTISPTTVCPA